MMRGIAASVIVVGLIAVAVVAAQSGAFNGPTPSPRTSPSLAPSATPSRAPTIPPSPSPSATPIDTSVTAAGQVVPLRSADLATRVSGIVSGIYVTEGRDAAANQLLLKVDQSTYLAAIDVAEGRVRLATAAVEQAQLQLDQLPPDASPGQIESVQANLRLAEAELDLAQSTLTDAQTALAQTEVRAPFAGTIADLAVEVGEQAVAGETVISIGDMTGWLIETTDLSELEVVRLAVGDRATATFHALPDLQVEGTVDGIQVRGTNAEGGVVFAVTIRPDNHHSELRWGLSSTVRITPSG